MLLQLPLATECAKYRKRSNTQRQKINSIIYFHCKNLPLLNVFYNQKLSLPHITKSVYRKTLLIPIAKYIIELNNNNNKNDNKRGRGEASCRKVYKSRCSFGIVSFITQSEFQMSSVNITSRLVFKVFNWKHSHYHKIIAKK